MKRRYAVSGMSCSSCASKIEDTLSRVEGVSSVRVDFGKKEALVEAIPGLESPVLNAALKKAGDYRLNPDGASAGEPKESPLRFLPLISAFALVSGFVFLRQYSSGSFYLISAMHDFMGAFFLVFSGFKFLDLKGFATAYSTYDIIAKRSRLYAYGYPFLEMLLGALYLMKREVVAASWAALALMSISSVGVGKALFSGKKIQCACLGTRFKIPMTKITFFEDVLMAAMAAAMIFLLR